MRPRSSFGGSLRGSLGRSVGWALALAAPLAGCNAVFGLEDRSFGSGGGGGGGGGDATTGQGTGTSQSSGTTASTGSCGAEDIARAGAFDPGWEGAWTTFQMDAFAEEAGGQPVLHAIVTGVDEGALTNVPAALPACADPCVRAAFSFYSNANFDLYVFLEHDDEAGTRVGLVEHLASTDGTFETLDSGPACRLPAGLTSVDRLIFQAFAPGDFLLDDVVLEISECGEGAPDCDVL